MELVSIQYLRAIAAMMVVLLHLHPQWERMGYANVWPDWMAGGVDIFFVISGFIMWITTCRKTPSPATFYYRRAVRIVPLYWLLSALVVAIMLVLPQVVQSARFDAWHVISSFFFIPTVSPFSGHFEPVLIPGWTLNYEMFFYLIFGAMLPLRERFRLGMTGLVLILLVLARPLVGQSDSVFAFYTSSIMLEFLLGMVLGYSWAHGGMRFGVRTGWLLVAVGLVGMMVLPYIGYALPRLVSLGFPATAIVAGALSLERAAKVPDIPWLHRLGDVSYSLYLSHPLVLSAVSQLWRRVIPADTPMPVSLLGFSLLAVVATIVAAVAVYRLLERPLIGVFRRG